MKKIINKFGVATVLIVTGFVFNIIETTYFGFNKLPTSTPEVIADYVTGAFMVAGAVRVGIDAYRARAQRPVDVCKAMVGHSFYVVTGQPLFTVITVIRVTDDDKVVYVVRDEDELRICQANMFTVNAKFLAMTDKIPVVDDRFTVSAEQ